MERTITKQTTLEYSAKMLIGLAVGLIATWAIGYPNVVTIPITVYLVCWSWRGLRGAIEYFGFRLRIQILFIIVDTLLMVLAKKLFPGWPAYCRFVLVICIVVPLWLRVYYKWKIMPLNLTAVFSSLIIVAGLMATPYYGSRRLLWNIVGLVIGLVLTFTIPGISKLGKCNDKLRSMLHVFAEGLGQAAGNGLKLPASLEGVLADAAAEYTTIAAYMTVVDKDCTKAVKFPMRLVPQAFYSGKYKGHEGEIAELHRLMKAFGALNALAGTLRTEAKGIAAMSAERKAVYGGALKTLSAAAEAVSAGEAPAEVPGVFTKPENDSEAVVLAAMSACSDALRSAS